MNIFNKILLFTASAFMFCACADESPWGALEEGNEGGLQIHISSTSDVSSSIPTVRTVDVDIQTPPSTDFSIRLTRNDGGYNKTWSSIEEFSKEEGFAPGIYSIEVFYGDPDAQGIITAVDKSYKYAYYYGKQDNVVVKPGETTTVQLHAALANSVVAIEYSDTFKNYFLDWGTKLNTKGKQALDLGEKEGWAYVTPGDVDVIISATHQNGKSVTLNPAVFVAEAKHLYKIRYNIYNDEVGHLDELQIIFNDDPEETHKIKVVISDELMNSEAPVVTVKPDKEFETEQGVAINQEVSFTVFSEAGLKSAELTAKKSNSTETRSFSWIGGSIELCGDTIVKDDMRADGVKFAGLENKTNYGLVDLTELSANLPEGVYEFTFKVTDILTRTAEETLKVTIGEGREITVTPEVAMFGEGYADIKVSYAGIDPTLPGKNPFSFKIDVDGVEKEANIQSINGIAYTRADDSQDYVYRIELPYTSGDVVPLKTFVNGNELSGAEVGTEIEYEFPKYDLEYDAFARRIKFRFPLQEDANPNLNKKNMDWYKKRMRVFVDNEGTEREFSLDNGGIYTVSGFSGNNSYKLKTTLQQKGTPDFFSSEETIQTEEEADVPNGKFENVTTTININPIQVGGPYGTSNWTSHVNTSSIKRNEADNWASLNKYTCCETSLNKNTWFLVPSTFVENNIAHIRTVGYNHNGVTPPKSNKAATYYSQNPPAEGQLLIKVGEMFLGEYNYSFNQNTESENRIDGILFKSRPSNFIFNYDYSSVFEEKGYFELIIRDSDNNILTIIKKELEEVNNSEKINISLGEYEFGKKAAKLEILFKSTSDNIKANINIPSGTDLKDNDTLWYEQTLSTNSYKAFAMGSELKISNAHFVYE